MADFDSVLGTSKGSLRCGSGGAVIVWLRLDRGLVGRSGRPSVEAVRGRETTAQRRSWSGNQNEVRGRETVDGSAGSAMTWAERWAIFKMPRSDHSGPAPSDLTQAIPSLLDSKTVKKKGAMPGFLSTKFNLCEIRYLPSKTCGDPHSFVEVSEAKFAQTNTCGGKGPVPTCGTNRPTQRGWLAPGSPRQQTEAQRQKS